MLNTFFQKSCCSLDNYEEHGKERQDIYIYIYIIERNTKERNFDLPAG